MEGETNDDAYAWEGSVERSWENIKEDEDGALQLETLKAETRKKQRMEVVRSVRKGLIRYLIVIMDLSKGMAEKDWKPHRCAVVSESLQGFIKDFLDQSPISQLGVLGIKGAHTERISDISGNVKKHIENIKSGSKTSVTEPSLQNALEMAKSALKIVPSYGSREILVLYGSLSTADPGDIFHTAESLKREKIRCSFVGLGAEMYLLRRIAEITSGTYDVATDPKHLRSCLTNFTIPPPTLSSATSKYSSLINMGFPERKKGGVLSLCVCHKKFTTEGYYCPRCRSKVCDLPTTCPVCNLSLVSSPHLARSYHHLFPVDTFIELEPQKSQLCYGCLENEQEMQYYECPKCHQVYCDECNIYIHDSLHNCIGCQEDEDKK